MKSGPKPVIVDSTITACYENLLNAIALQAVFDYETLISDAPVPVVMGDESIEKIRLFARDTPLTGYLDRIDRIYQNEFKPYVEEHYKEIWEDWPVVQKARGKNQDVLVRQYKHKCPVCGGSLRPMLFGNAFTRKKIGHSSFIGCSSCNLNARVPGGNKK